MIQIHKKCQASQSVLPRPWFPFLPYMGMGLRRGSAIITSDQSVKGLNFYFLWKVRILYLSFRPDELSSQQGAITAAQNCIKAIRSWMDYDKLLLNDEKTEFLIIGTRQQLCKVTISSITVGNIDVMRSSSCYGPWLLHRWQDVDELPYI